MLHFTAVSDQGLEKIPEFCVSLIMDMVAQLFKTSDFETEIVQI